MTEDIVVDNRNVEDGEDEDKANNDGGKEKLVAPDVNHPLGEVTVGLGLHAEKAATRVDRLPGEEE